MIDPVAMVMGIETLHLKPINTQQHFAQVTKSYRFPSRHFAECV